MDRSADGGMAPALQSSNHQSTSLAEDKVDQNKTVLPHDKVKVNGKRRESDLCSGDCNSDTESGVVKADVLGGDCSHEGSEKSDLNPKADAYTLSGMKEVLSDINMPALHLGQGDSAVAGVGNYNGWSDRKKSFIGSILQESDDFSSLHMGTKSGLKKSLTQKNNSDDYHDINDLENHINGRSHNSSSQHNGHSKSPSKGTLDSGNKCDSTEKAESLDKESFPTKPLVWSGRRNGDTETPDQSSSLISFSGIAQTDSTSSGQATVTETHHMHIDAKPGEGVSDHRQEGSDIDSSKPSLAPQTANSHFLLSESHENENKKSVESGECFKINDRTARGVSVGNLPGSFREAFSYSQLLSSGLSSVNIANTVQELTASLIGSSFPLEVNRVSDQTDTCESNDTVKSEGAGNSLRKSVKSLDFSTSETNEMLGLKDRVTAKIASCAHNIKILEHSVNLLKHNLDQLRSRTLNSHIRKEMALVASHLPKHDWENLPVCVTHTESVYPSTEFWQKLFEGNGSTYPKNPRHHSSEQTHSSSKDSISTVSHSSPSEKVKSDASLERKVYDDLDGIDIIPIVPLTRIDQVDTSVKSDRHKLADRARTNVGVLKKELRYAQSCCDPELTESSSDEDVKEAYCDKTLKTKSNSKSKVKPRIAKWIAERAEISRWWTWLQSSISRLEFDIRRQGDLYNQLRENKGAVHLVASEKSTLQHDAGNSEPVVFGTSESGAVLDSQSSLSESPCNINLVLDNVNHQASRLFDKLSPVSGGWPSPVQHVSSNSEQSSIGASCVVSSDAATTLQHETTETCARTRLLQLNLFKTRKLVKIHEKNLMSSKPLQPATVPNDSSIMCMKMKDSYVHERENYTSLIFKAAVHDHSYHAAISSLKDIPLSISIRAVMKSKHKWLKKSSLSESSRTGKVVKKAKRKSRNKPRLHLSESTNHLSEIDDKRRKLSSQISESSTKKRSYSGAFEQYPDSPVVVGGFNSHQSTASTASGATTPTHDITGQNQNHWKKKKTTEQSFDINNIVIPHGLNSTRIEKLVYKEIQTPSWKVLEIPKRSNELGSKEVKDKELEDTSDAAFQSRHDIYEIAEKRKYVAFMEWSKSRRGSRGSLMGSIRTSTTSEPMSPSSLGGDTPNPMPFATEPFANSFPSSSQAISTSPTAKPSTTAQEVSVDQLGPPVTPPRQALPLNQRNVDTSLPSSCPSPSLQSWQDNCEAGRTVFECPARVNSRTPSTGAIKTDDAQLERWDARTFPLSGDDVRLLDDIEYAKAKLNCSHISKSDHLHHRIFDAENGTKNLFPRQPSIEKATLDNIRSGSFEGSKDATKSCGIKRRRTDSRASSLASHDDAARHSDASSTSVSSSRRKKKNFCGHPRSIGQKRSSAGGKGHLKVSTSSRKSKQKYMYLRLSETDDSSADSETDSNSSDEDFSASSDDAGHIVDDYADPEWEAPMPRQRGKR